MSAAYTVLSWARQAEWPFSGTPSGGGKLSAADSDRVMMCARGHAGTANGYKEGDSQARFEGLESNRRRPGHGWG